jgi:ATP-dependent Clp protease ATP-binding subunit ClpC
MTSNLMPEKHMGFGLFGGVKSSAESAAGDLKKYFRVEFLNRIDEIIVFKDLSEDDIRKILKPIMDEVAGMVMERSGAELVFEPGAVKAIIEAGYSRQYGARELRRAFDRAVQVPLSKLSLGGEFAKHKKWAVRSAGTDEVLIVPV